ncbi:MAG: transposase [Lachnospiraceae bacterium]|nr:transposase [Lachnospiraceae bacterium]
MSLSNIPIEFLRIIWINIKVKKLENRKRRLQHFVSRKYKKNLKGECYCKTSNIIKSEKELLKLTQRLTNIRKDSLHQTMSEFINWEPSSICMEDKNVSGMMKNKHLSKTVQQQGFHELNKQIEYKGTWNNIPVRIADRFFPDSKLCIFCGNIKKDLKLSDRIYKCECGNVTDRNYQAALNLKR